MSLIMTMTTTAAAATEEQQQQQPFTVELLPPLGVWTEELLSELEQDVLRAVCKRHCFTVGTPISELRARGLCHLCDAVVREACQNRSITNREAALAMLTGESQAALFRAQLEEDAELLTTLENAVESDDQVMRESAHQRYVRGYLAPIEVMFPEGHETLSRMLTPIKKKRKKQHTNKGKKAKRSSGFRLGSASSPSSRRASLSSSRRRSPRKRAKVSYEEVDEEQLEEEMDVEAQEHQQEQQEEQQHPWSDEDVEVIERMKESLGRNTVIIAECAAPVVEDGGEARPAVAVEQSLSPPALVIPPLQDAVLALRDEDVEAETRSERQLAMSEMRSWWVTCRRSLAIVSLFEAFKKRDKRAGENTKQAWSAFLLQHALQHNAHIAGYEQSRKYLRLGEALQLYQALMYQTAVFHISDWINQRHDFLRVFLAYLEHHDDQREVWTKH